MCVIVGERHARDRLALVVIETLQDTPLLCVPDPNDTVRRARAQVSAAGGEAEAIGRRRRVIWLQRDGVLST